MPPDHCVQQHPGVQGHSWARSALLSNPEGVIHGDRLRVYFRWQQPDAPGGSVDYVVALDSELACDGLFGDGFED